MATRNKLKRLCFVLGKQARFALWVKKLLQPGIGRPWNWILFGKRLWLRLQIPWCVCLGFLKNDLCLDRFRHLVSWSMGREHLPHTKCCNLLWQCHRRSNHWSSQDLLGASVEAAPVTSLQGQLYCKQAKNGQWWSAEAPARCLASWPSLKSPPNASGQLLWHEGSVHGTGSARMLGCFWKDHGPWSYSNPRNFLLSVAQKLLQAKSFLHARPKRICLSVFPASNPSLKGRKGIKKAVAFYKHGKLKTRFYNTVKRSHTDKAESKAP